MDGVSMSGNVQGSVDKNSRAPPWRDMGQRTEFPCLEMCRGLWIKTPVPLPGGIWANGQSFHVQKCAGSMDKNSGTPSWRDMGQWTECPCLEKSRGPWIKTPKPLPKAIQANRLCCLCRALEMGNLQLFLK